MAAKDTGSLRALRRTNSERMLSALMEHGALHRAELARICGVSRTTVSTIVADLITGGVVIEVVGEQVARAGIDASEVDGRARGFLRANPSAGAAAGLDFTLERVWCHLADLSGGTLASDGVRVGRDTPWQERLAAGLALLDDLLEQTGRGRGNLVGVAIGVPGPIDLQTGVVGPSLPGQAWAGVNVAAEFGRRIDVPVLVENNTRLEAVAEFTWGAGRDVRDVLYLGLSTGIGSGLLVDGNLHHGGARGGGGEIGHLSADSNGEPCPCGNRGCLVQYASLQAVLAALAPVLGADAGLDELLAAAADGQPDTLRVLRDAGELTGRVLANICNLLNPERIIVGGELARAGDLILDPIRATLRRTAMSLTRDVDVVAAELDLGARAGASGAAALVLRQTDQLVAALLSAPDRQPNEAV
ncbi:ROK family transcriptional regulator [Kribbella sindirgiensis]|uniref:ROK family transcriptional regulator n=1 Tax=Kribbella sindirgiensis TaxID=1124744 RepID=A0A4R0I8U4_9ACTN|nr:ROK family transcriptional regulator [Kribbella sindirgiensis]TCC26287.1 ROK family transcriptional regulator [Kribbella sindirgiensis]